jgi:hypothetical protein
VEIMSVPAGQNGGCAPRRSPRARALGCSAAHDHTYSQCRPAWRCRSDKRASNPS